MPRRSADLPHPLSAVAFTTATGRAAGLSRSALRAPRFERPYSGVRRVRAEPDGSPHVEAAMARACRDNLPLLRPHETFSHTTALLLFGAPIHAPPHVHLTVPLPSGPARGRGVFGHNCTAPLQPVLAQGAYPCSPLLVALAQSAPLLVFRELVVAIDRLILPRGRPGAAHALVPAELLASFLAEFTGRGAQRLRAAFEVAREGAESRPESELHFELARHGIDTLELQAELRDRDGGFIGRFDEMDREARKILEYDGEQHRTDRAQYLKDITRLDRARDEGHLVLRLHREDLRLAALPRTGERLCHFLGRDPQPVPRRLARYFAEPLHRALKPPT